MNENENESVNHWITGLDKIFLDSNFISFRQPSEGSFEVSSVLMIGKESFGK